LTTNGERDGRDVGWLATTWVCLALIGPWWLLGSVGMWIGGTMPAMAMTCGLFLAMLVIALLDAVCPIAQQRLCERIVRATAPRAVIERIEVFEASRANGR
jgi:hypothetical protein